jgi:hypothetical protein
MASSTALQNWTRAISSTPVYSDERSSADRSLPRLTDADLVGTVIVKTLQSMAFGSEVIDSVYPVGELPTADTASFVA